MTVQNLSAKANFQTKSMGKSRVFGAHVLREK